MATGFLEYGNWLRAQNKAKQAVAKFSMAERLAEPTSEVARLALAAIEWQKAVDLQRAGVVEPSLYDRILKKNPEHREAKKWHKKLTSESLPIERYIYKTIAVSLIIFLAGILVTKRLRS